MLLVEEMRINVQQAERSPQAKSQEIKKRLGILEQAMISALNGLEFKSEVSDLVAILWVLFCIPQRVVLRIK